MKPNYAYEAIVVKVIDGDTVKLLVDVGFHVHIRQSIRLLGVAAPELSTPEGQEIAIAVRDLLPVGDWVIVQTSRQDKYGRWLGVVWTKDGAELNENIRALLREGRGK